MTTSHRFQTFRRLCWQCGCVLAALSLGVLPAQIVQLRSGELVLGKIEQPDDTGFVLRRFDNGGTLELRWEQLAPTTVQRVKALFQLSLDDESEFMVEADRIVFEPESGGREEIIGKIVESESGNGKLVVERQTTRWELASNRVRQVERVSAPVRDIYTLPRFYNDQLAEIAPGENADKHVLLADVLMRVRAYERAKEHLDRAVSLGGGSQPAALEGKLKRLALLKAARAETELIDSIKIMMARGQWNRGLAKIAEYEQKFSKGKLLLEFEKVQSRFSKARARAVARLLVDRWLKVERNLAKQLAGRPIGFEEARQAVEQELGKDIRSAVAKGIGIEEEEVEELWTRRAELGAVGRAERYTYGVGSWLLGADAVIKDTVVAKAKQKKKPKSSGGLANDDRARRLKEALQRARRAARGSAGAGGDAAGQMTADQWWSDASRDQRWVFLRAYYAEFSGDHKLVSAHADPCITCAARGFLEVIEASGKVAKQTCPTCQGTAFKRWIYAK